MRHLSILTVLVSIAVATGIATQFSARSQQEEISGQATVIDGDTIEIHGTRIRLRGIDAPEAAQLCSDAAGKRYRCGQTASFALADYIGRSTISCAPEISGSGRVETSYNRVIAICLLRGRDLGSWLIESGWAVPYWKYGGNKYRDEYNRAREAKLGIWSGSFEDPSAFRERLRRQ